MWLADLKAKTKRGINMTTNELIKILSCYPHDAEIEIANKFYIKKIDRVSTCVDIDTNKIKVIIYSID